MHVVVVGCGRVGSALAAGLVERGPHRRDHRQAAGGVPPPRHRASPGQTIVGIGFDRDRLIEAGIEQAGAVAAVTNGDNSNILIARVARETYGIERVVARIYDPRRAAIYQRLGIPTVATVRVDDRAGAAPHPARRAARVEWVDPSAKVCLVERGVPAAWAGTPLCRARGRRPGAGRRRSAGWASAHDPDARPRRPGGRRRVRRGRPATRIADVRRTPAPGRAGGRH